MPNLPPAHNAKDPKCKCCLTVIEYNSEGYRWGYCISCIDAIDHFITNRQSILRKRGLIKK